jgi:hypothetical protein
VAESPNVTRSDSSHPRLGIRDPRQKTIGGGCLIRVDFVLPTFNIDRDETSLVPLSDDRFDIPPVNRFATPCKLFLAVAWFRCGHRNIPKKILSPQLLYHTDDFLLSRFEML